MNLRERLSMSFLRRVIAKPEGRAHVLRELADAEGNGENGFFEVILAKMDDPQLRRLVEKHKADELRHEQLFLACAERTGAPVEPVPDEVKYVERVYQRTGFYDKPIENGRDIMEAYLLLQAVEERSVIQFALMEQVFREVDPATADVFLVIIKDEERHIKYCDAIARRYAPDEASRVHVLRRMRELEAECFADNGRANMAYTFSRGYFDGGALVKFAFRTLQRLGARAGGLPLTPFFDEPAPAMVAA